MKALVAYYSRTGNTGKLAAEIARALGADAEAIIDRKSRQGLLGWLGAGKDATKKVASDIEEPKKDPSAYDLVLVGTPVWAHTVSAPVLAYLKKFSGKFPEVAFFICHGGNPRATSEDMAAAAGRRPKATLEVHGRELKTGEHAGKLREFLSRLSP